MAIVLLTDFGIADGYVGTMKGVITKIAPDTPIIDLAHDLPPYQISHAALILSQTFHFFPHQTIFVVVVDPGVGSERKPILVKTDRYTFIAPDNGVLTLALEQEENLTILNLNNPDYFLSEVSATFHGRDIFAPIAAHLSKGEDLSKLGTLIHEYFKLPKCHPKVQGDHLEGVLLAIDRFGNGITNFHRSFIESHLKKKPFGLKFVGTKNKPVSKLLQYYAEGKVGEIFLVFGSSGYLEIAQREGSAAEKLHLQIGQKILITELT